MSDKKQPPSSKKTPPAKTGKDRPINPSKTTSQGPPPADSKAYPDNNYSDYTQTISTKSHYEDALFNDEEALDKALANSVAETQPGEIEIPTLTDQENASPASNNDDSNTLALSGISPADNRYSDYDIEIEAKNHYEDALFADADALDNALTASHKEDPAKMHKQSTQAQNDGPSARDCARDPQPTENEQPVIDLAIFLTDKTKNGAFKNCSDQQTSKHSRLSVDPAGVNGSPVSAYIDYDDGLKIEPEIKIAKPPKLTTIEKHKAKVMAGVTLI